jgi:protein required for attachment to host cells
MRVPHDAHVLVADGRKLLFFRNEGDADYPHLEVVLAEEQDNPADRDQASDAAGRASSPHGPARSAVDQTDFHQLEADRFAAQAADLLKRRALANEYESLIVVAPPQTLGELRKHYHKEVERRLTGELAKDLTGHSVSDIERILADAA